MKVYLYVFQLVYLVHTLVTVFRLGAFVRVANSSQ